MLTATPITRQTVGKSFTFAIAILGTGAVLQLAAVCWAFIERFHSPRPPATLMALQAEGDDIPTLARPVPDFSVDPLENGEPAVASPSPKAATPPPKPTPIPAQPPKPPDPGNAERFTELLEQGKMLRERGDTGAALTKFREAQVLDPRNARAIAEIAMTYGKMGLTDRAAEQWRRIYDIGETAGVFYAAAEAHLKAAQQETIRSTPAGTAPPAAESVEPGGAVLDLLALASVESKDPLASKKFTLRIPMKARSGAKISVNDLTIQVHFYDVVDTSRVERTGANVASRWSTAPADWLESDTEVLEVDFDLPVEKKNRKYYGYLVRLYYKGALQASAGTPDVLIEKYPPPPKLQTDPDK